MHPIFQPDAVCVDVWPEKSLVGRSFGRAALGYDGVAGLQRQVGDALLKELVNFPFLPQVVVDVGAGTGYCTQRLSGLLPQARIVVVDLAEGMLHQARARPALREHSWFVCGDAEFLPLAEASVDLIFSNLALQWCADLHRVFAGFRRVLRPGGGVLFSTFGEATLHELRTAWSLVDDYSHVNAFAPKAQVEAELRRAGFDEFSLVSRREELLYADVGALMGELKGLGAHNVTPNRPRHLMGKGSLQRMFEAYRTLMPDDQTRASFDIMTGGAWRK